MEAGEEEYERGLRSELIASTLSRKVILIID